MDSNQIQWWQLTFSSADPDLDATTLCSIGASGAEILSDQQFRVFFSGDVDRLKTFQEQVLAEGFVPSSVELIEPSNWTKKCSELWEELTVNGLTIVPVMSPELGDAIHARGPSFLPIIPGTGFGTGHHATTSMILAELLNLTEQNHSQILDLGTGSGILAIACAKLFGAKIDAIDTDPDALVNAEENCAMNHVLDKVRLIHGDMSQASKDYDLIIANIYAEVLIGYEAEFSNRLHPGGILLLSGIKEELGQMVKDTFLNWTVVNELLKDGWYCMSLQPKPVNKMI